ncbi:hypothetical protein J5491_03275 [Candidatus Saccharibacteria bacterium]|nr:hypothetical protein [Candidatus Saccharibacteria bacterium]
MKKKVIFCVVGVATIVLLVVCVVLVLQAKGNGVSVNILPSNSIGGATKYEVTGARSEMEANKAIIQKEYSDNEFFRAITEQELQNIVNKIAADGCGQITESYTLGPPVDDAINWTNYGNDNHDDIAVYMFDEKYLVTTDCLGH